MVGGFQIFITLESIRNSRPIPLLGKNLLNVIKP